MNLPKLIVILGTNASGKSSIAIELAKKYNGEIISSDSRQVYRGLNLGSGKITLEEMNEVPHYMLDIINPNDPFSVADFQKQAYTIIDDIIKRGKQPFLVGGTGLYIKAVVDGYVFSDMKRNLNLIKELEDKDISELTEMLSKQVRTDKISIDLKNKRRIIRALEKISYGIDIYKEPKCMPKYETLQLGITWPKEILHKRIDQRLTDRIDQGMIEEVEQLIKNGATYEFLYNLGLEYRYIQWYLTGKFNSLDEFYCEMSKAIKRFSKRQMTWFKKDKRIVWLSMENDYINQAIKKIDDFIP